MREVYVSGFDTIRRGADTIFVRPEWKSLILADLLNDFHGVEDRQAHNQGRAPHFSYQPAGAPYRVLVRRAMRGGLAAVLGSLYFGIMRPLREIQAAAAATRAGVNVPEIVAAKATRVGGLFYRFSLVVKEISGASTLLMATPHMRPADKRGAIGRLAEELRRLHEAGVYHGDLTLKNLLLSQDDIYVIDLDKSRLRPRPEEERAIRNLSRLNRSIEKCFGRDRIVTRTDKVRFLRRYLGTRDRIREIARRCAAGLWFHRFWWSLLGQSS